VWWTPEELTAGIHSHVPLYRGRMPDAGNLSDAVKDALEMMLEAKGVTATVDHVIAEPTWQHPTRIVNFRVERPRVRVQSAALTGVPAELAAEVQKVEVRVAGSAYNEGLVGETLDDKLIAPLRNAGHIAATVEDRKREVSSSSNGTTVTYSARVEAGPAYKVSAIIWEATPLFSGDDFAHVSKLRAGDVASNAALQAVEGRIVTVYRGKGYLDVYVDRAQKLDEAAHTVSYTLRVHSGEQYRVKSVTPVGLSLEAQRDFDIGWKMKAGEVYSPGYVTTFLTNNTALRNLAGYSAGFQASADPVTHLVDLTINFVGKR
jgi:hypothetical protein